MGTERIAPNLVIQVRDEHVTIGGRRPARRLRAAVPQPARSSMIRRTFAFEPTAFPLASV